MATEAPEGAIQVATEAPEGAIQVATEAPEGAPGTWTVEGAAQRTHREAASRARLS